MFMRWAVVAAALVTTLAIIGCGGSPVSRAYGSISDSDMRTLEAFSRGTTTLQTGFASMSSALEANDLEKARREIGSLDQDVQKLTDTTIDLDNGKLRATLQDYVDKVAVLLAAFDRWVSYFEDDSTPRDQAAEDQMLADIQRASQAVRSADTAILNRILDQASPKQRAEIRERYRAAQAQTTGQ
jgi:Skp family chaperone for outer membrane proteins